VESWTYRAPETTGGAEALPEGDFERYLFTYAVHDPKEPPLEVSFVFVTTGAGALEALLLLLALALLSVVAHRRALREPLRGRDWVLLVAGVLLLVVKAGAFGLGVGGTLLAALVLVAVAVVGRRAREREEVAA